MATVKNEITRQFEDGGGFQITEFDNGGVLLVIRKPGDMTSQEFEKHTIRVSKALENFKITVKRVEI